MVHEIKLTETEMKEAFVEYVNKRMTRIDGYKTKVLDVYISLGEISFEMVKDKKWKQWKK